MDAERLLHTGLFCGFDARQAAQLVRDMRGLERSFARGAVMCAAQEPAAGAGLLLSGRAQVEYVDPWGNQSILAQLEPGSLFAEMYACCPDTPLLVSVRCVEPCTALFLDVRRILARPGENPLHSRFAGNFIGIMARKSLALTQKIHCTAPKTIRGRVLCYLGFRAAEARAADFTIPFSRQQLADYLCVDRSALSAELGKMRRDGLLSCTGRRFVLNTGRK